jgi:TolB protein
VMEMTNGSQSTSHVFVVNADGTNLKDLGVGCMPNFSGDGTRIVCSVPGKGIVTMQSDGTARDVISAKGWGAQWSPDGTCIAFAEGDNITLLDVTSRKTSHLLTGDAASRYRSVVNPGWSHDGRSITFKGLRKDVAREELSLMTLEPAGELKILHPNAHSVIPDVTYSPDNQQVLVGITGVASHVTRLHSLNGKGPASPIFAASLSEHQITGYAWSHDGKMIAITSHWSAPYVEWTNRPITTQEPK